VKKIGAILLVFFIILGSVHGVSAWITGSGGKLDESDAVFPYVIHLVHDFNTLKAGYYIVAWEFRNGDTNNTIEFYIGNVRLNTSVISRTYTEDPPSGHITIVLYKVSIRSMASTIGVMQWLQS